MGVLWYRQDAAAVRAALARGERPDVATTMACGPLDELVALHDELGVFAILDDLKAQRQRAGLPDGLLLRTLATLPFVAEASLSGAAGALFREPAVLLRLGWAPVAIRAGTNGRHRHPAGRRPESLPCHPDALRDALRRLGEAAWDRAQRAGVAALYDRRLVRGRVYAIDGSGLGAGLRVVALVCVSGERPVIAAWRLLEGAASEKGKEACVTRALVEQAQALGGPGRSGCCWPTPSTPTAPCWPGSAAPGASTPWSACRPTAACTESSTPWRRPRGWRGGRTTRCARCGGTRRGGGWRWRGWAG
jgi:hypothetical protein